MRQLNKLNLTMVLAFLLAMLPSLTAFAQQNLHCPTCDRNYPKAPKYCPHDGNRLVEQTLPHKACPGCQLIFHHGEKYCPHHGLKLVDANPRANPCKKCGRLFQKGEKFCPFDGTSLKPDNSPIPEATTPSESRVIRKDNTNNPPATVINKPKAPTTPTTVAELTKAEQHSFAINTTSSATIPVKNIQPGKVQLTATFEGGGKVLLLFYAEGKTAPVLRKEGFSPLNTELLIDPEIHPIGVQYDVIISHREGPNCTGKLTINRAVSGFEKASTPKPKDAQKAKPTTPPTNSTDPITENKDSKKRPFEIVNGKTQSLSIPNCDRGLLKITVRFELGKEITAILVNEADKKTVAKVSGKAPLNLNYSVPADHQDLKLLLISFDGKNIKGSVNIASVK